MIFKTDPVTNPGNVPRTGSDLYFPPAIRAI